jgi:hypothetical protein
LLGQSDAFALAFPDERPFEFGEGAHAMAVEAVIAELQDGNTGNNPGAIPNALLKRDSVALLR